MYKLAVLLLLVLVTVVCKAQGSWDIGYVRMEELAASHIGMMVRIDFKHTDSMYVSGTQRQIRSYVGSRDTGEIVFDTKKYLFEERRSIYVDLGRYKDQFLACINCSEGTVYIFDATILAVDKETVLFSFDIETAATDKTVKREQRVSRMYRKMLDGVMFKR